MCTARSLGSLLVLAILPAFQGGDRPNADRPDRDPPGRVGRLSFVTGSVSFRPGDVDDWVPATVNYPLHDGDHLWTDSDARAEITVGSTAFRLAPQSALGFLALDDRSCRCGCRKGRSTCACATCATTRVSRSTRRAAPCRCSAPASIAWTSIPPATRPRSRCGTAQPRSPPPDPPSRCAASRRPSSWVATRRATTSRTRSGRTTGKTGAPRATAAGTSRARPATCRAT